MGLARACVVSACELKLMHFGDPPDDPPSTPILVRSKSSGMYRALTFERLEERETDLHLHWGLAPQPGGCLERDLPTQ